MKFFKQNRLVYHNNLEGNIDNVYYLGGLEKSTDLEKVSLNRRRENLIKTYNEALKNTLSGGSYEGNITQQLSLLPDHAANLKPNFEASKRELDEKIAALKLKLDQYNIPEEHQSSIEYMCLYHANNIRFSSVVEEEILSKVANLSAAEISEIQAFLEENKKEISTKRLEKESHYKKLAELINLQFEARSLDKLKRQSLLKLTRTTGINFTDFEGIKGKDINLMYLSDSEEKKYKNISFEDITLLPSNPDADLQNPSANTYEVYFSVKIPNPTTGELQSMEMTQAQLEAFLENGLVLDKSIKSKKALQESIQWDIFNFQIEPQTISFQDRNGYQTAEIIGIDESNLQIKLDKQVSINGLPKDTLSFSKFSKWALKSKVTPIISKQQFQSAVSSLHTNIVDRFGVEKTEEFQLSLEPGTEVTSLLTGQQIKIVSIDDNNLVYETSGQEIKKPLGAALLYLNDIGAYTSPIPPSTPSTSNSNQSNPLPAAATPIPTPSPPLSPPSDSEETVDGDEPPNPPNNGGSSDGGGPSQPQDKEESDSNDESTDGSYKAVSAVWDLKPLNPKDLFMRAATANHSLYWLNIDEIVSLATEGFNSIKEDIKTEADYKFHTMAEKLGLVGPTFKNLRKATKGKKVEGHTAILEQLTPNEQIARLYGTDDFFEFYAALRQLEEKGLIPLRDIRFVNKINYFVHQLGLPTKYLVNYYGENGNYEQKNIAIKSFLDAVLDPPAGTNMIRSNESNYKSFVSKYQSEMMDVLPDKPDAGMTLLHNALVDYKNSKDSSVTAAQIEGYILAVLDEGIDYEQTVPYIIHAIYTKNKFGLDLLSPDFIPAIKKQYPFLNMFLTGADAELKYLMENDCKLDLSSKKSSDDKFEKTPQGRFVNYEKAKLASQWLLSNTTNRKKGDAYLEQSIDIHDYAGKNLATISYSLLETQLHPAPSMSRVKIDTLQKFQKQMPLFFASHCRLSNDEVGKAFRKKSEKFDDYRKATRYAISNWYIVYASSHKMTLDRNNAKTLTQDQADELMPHNNKMKAFTAMLLAEKGLSSEEIYNHLFANYMDTEEGQGNSPVSKLKAKNESLERIIRSIDLDTFDKVMKKADQENLFTSDTAWQNYVQPPGPPIGVASNDNQEQSQQRRAA